MFVWWRVLAQKKGRGLATITPDIGMLLVRILSPPSLHLCKIATTKVGK